MKLYIACGGLALMLALSGCEIGKPLVYGTRPLFLASGHRLHDSLKDQDSQTKDRFGAAPTLLQIGAVEFFYEQNSGKPFTFTSHVVKRRGDFWKIQPESMLTTGSSIPRVLWGVRGFGPFDFTKSSVIHDWLFEAHHRWCIAYYAKDSTDPATVKKARETLKKYQDYADPDLNAILVEEHDPAASPVTLSIDDAADIMAECINWEMHQCHHFVNVLKQQLKEDEGKSPSDPNKMTAGERRGLEGMVDDFDEVDHDEVTLAQYHWAIRSFVAKEVWDPGKKGKGAENTHSSSDRTVALLEKQGLIEMAIKDGFVSEDLAGRVRRILQEAKVYHQLELKVEREVANRPELQLKLQKSLRRTRAEALKKNTSANTEPAPGGPTPASPPAAS